MIKTTRKMVKADSCKNKTWQADELEAAIEDYVNRLLFDKKFYKRLVEDYEREKEKASDETTEADVIKKKISDCDKQIGKLMDLLQEKCLKD